MTKVIAFAGKKRSGKNSCGNFIMGTVMWGLGIIKDSYGISEDGKLWVSDIYGNSDECRGVIDFDNRSQEAQMWLAEEVYPYARCYSFADTLKDICISVLGLKWKHVYGSESERNSLTHLRWQDMPGVVDPYVVDKIIADFPAIDRAALINSLGLIEHAPGNMTGREVMQFVGTEVFRKMYTNVWIDCIFRKISDQQPLFAIITDCRFKNEAKAIQDFGGTVIHLTRNVSNDDSHSSENDLDDYDDFDYKIDNSQLSIPKQNNEVRKILESIGVLSMLEYQNG